MNKRAKFYEQAFLAVLPAATTILLVGNKLPVPPPTDKTPETEKAWENYRQIADAIAEFASFVAMRASFAWKEELGDIAVSDAKEILMMVDELPEEGDSE